MSDLAERPPSPSANSDDEGQSFQDAAADVETNANVKEDGEGQDAEGVDTDATTITTPANDTKSEAKTTETGKAKGKGVASLLARFEAAGKTGEANEKSAQPTTSRVGDETARKEKEGESDANADVEEKDSAIPPSEGATSLIDPTETITNPFAAENESSNVTTDTSPQTPYVDLKRFSGSSQPQQAPEEAEGNAQPSVPDTPSNNAHRFSVVSLGTSHTTSSKRKTIFAASEPTQEDQEPDLEPTGSSAFLTRNTARLSLHEGQRDSASNTEKLKEKLNELRNAHSHRDDESAPGQSSSDSVATTSERPVESGRDEADEGGATANDTQNGDDHIDWDFWGDVMSNYQEIARTQPRKLSHAIQAGIPSALRGMMWQLMSSSKDEEMEIIYAYCLKQTSPHEKMIRKDLARTFPGQDYFQDGKGIGQENLFNVVKAYSLYDEECGYCQGMQFVVGPLLLNMPDEEAFSTLVRLMKSYDLRGHFVPNMPALQLRLFQFERLLEEFLPLLYRHLVRQGVKSSMYASGWIMTLFTYRSPLSICFRILDSVFAEGIEALFRFALALMRKNEEQLLNMSFDEAVPLLAGRVFDVYKSEEEATDGQDDAQRTPNIGRSTSQGFEDQNVHRQRRLSHDEKDYRVSEFISDAFTFQITPFMLDTYASDFAEQVKAATAHRREMEQLKVENRGLQIRVKSLEDQLGAVQQEHVELVKSVVMAKLAREEMAEELMRYKMMYAEAALLVDQNNVAQPLPPPSPSTSTSDEVQSALPSARESQ